MKIINVPDASVRIAGIEIIDSVKSVASVLLKFCCLWSGFRQLSMGFIVLLSFVGCFLKAAIAH
ncbi:hypothetical protein [Escherichia coli]|uniref:hypothetical protein n=1 Tax=Escherichia coli TaxID=562 RepID=UPI000F135D58|nr:hypothetical protein [Escherichia coli]VCZ14005.1 hypothetical protein BANRA_05059 [Escherichia coli]